MTDSVSATKTLFRPGLGLVTALLSLVLFSTASAQERLERQYPELAQLFNSFDVAHAALFEQLVAINNSPQTRNARSEFQEHMMMLAAMAADPHGSHGGHGAHMEMLMNGPYDEMESESRASVLEIVRGEHSAEQAATAFQDSETIPMHTARVLQLGREFERKLYEIYLDDSVSDKQAAVDAAVQDYLADERHSVPTAPKVYTVLASAPHATAFQSGFPKLSGLLWANQWLQMAALEAIMVEYRDTQFRNTVDVVLERYWNKVGSASGMSMFPAPVDLPMSATITPTLYSFHPQAAVILDNLNMLETRIADSMAYPNLDDREAAIDVAVAEFTDKASNLTRDDDYLLAALRGGIYNQGGPAVGELNHSERNRSRSEMNMQHTMIMSSPQ